MGSEAFESGVLTGGIRDCILNYIWINKEPFKAVSDGPSCGVPLHYIDMVIANAQKYPKADFNIWLDPELLRDSPTLDILDAHIKDAGCDNISIRDLRDIPEYRNSPFYSQELGVPVWHRVDMARLLVVSEGLRDNPDKTVIYSDFDVGDIAIESKTFNSAMEKYGFVIGATRYLDEEAGADELNLENGYFAVRDTEAANDLFSAINYNAYEVTGAGVDDERSDVFFSYRRTIQGYCAEREIDQADFLLNVLQPCTYQIPPNPRYEGFSI